MSDLSGEDASPVPEPQPTRMKLNFGPLSGRSGRGVAEEHALRHRDHLRVDADAREHLPDRLGDLGVVRIAVVGRVDGEAEAVRHARLGEELLRAVRVVGHGLQLVAHAEEALGQELPGLDRLAFHHPAHDRVAVDRHGDRLAHAHVAQRVLDRAAVLRPHEGRIVAEVVEVQVDDAVRHRLRDGELRVLLEPLHVHRRHLVDHVDVAREQRRDARRVGLDAAEITRCHAGFSPQYCSFRCTTMRLPGVYSTKRYGPVPIAALPEL